MTDDTSRFADLFEQWLLSRKTQRTRLSKRLISSYRNAWLTNKLDARSAVLGFLYWTRDAGGFDLILESLTDLEPSIAQTGACTALALLSKGENLSPDFASAFEEFAARHPEWRPIADAATFLIGRGATDAAT
jgi:hypothetical protein